VEEGQHDRLHELGYLVGLSSSHFDIAQLLTCFSAFAFAVVKVSSNTSLLGTPTLNQLYTNALHIGLWNSIENDLIIVAACLPSTRPLFKACKIFTQIHVSMFTASKSRRIQSSSDSQHSLKANSEHEVNDMVMLEMNVARATKVTSEKDRNIQVRHDIELQSDRERSDVWNTRS
jgi:hypothetical protein